MADSDNWCTVESDPGIFTEMMTSFGVKDVQMEELWSLDSESMKNLAPIYGVIFLFKWKNERDARPIDTTSKVFFASQVINNACATQAILSILLNAKDVELGPELTEFQKFTADFPPDLKGLAIGNSALIRNVHNSFSRPEPISLEKATATESDDVYHFISYVPVNGALFELDGLKTGPINLGPCDESNWVDVLCPIIQKRIERYAQSEIRFNLMAIVKDREAVISEQIEDVEAQLLSLGAGESMDVRSDDAAESESSSSSTDSSEEVGRLKVELSRLQNDLESEKEKKQKWKDENQRRRHNYLPFVMALLKQLAEKKQLSALVEKAQAKKATK